MTCEEVERDELAERYVLGRLDPGIEDAFEDHYFDCAVCLERVRAIQDAREQLSAQKGIRRSQRWSRVAAAVAAAAVVVFAVRVGQQMLSEQPAPPTSTSPRADVVLPAPPPPVTIELPPYTPPRLRAVSTEAQRVFRDAMTSYLEGNCGGAIPGLQRALAIDGSFTQARFYLAACELQQGQTSQAAEGLQRVIGVGESPYLEDARFLLAQARIQQGDRDGAREELRRVIALQGHRRAQAQRLLDELR